MHWSERVSEMQSIHLWVHRIVGFSSSFLQSCLERKLCHNCCYDVLLLLLHFHKEHMCIWMERSVIFQLGHSNGTIRACHAGYIIIFLSETLFLKTCTLLGFQLGVLAPFIIGLYGVLYFPELVLLWLVLLLRSPIRPWGVVEWFITLDWDVTTLAPIDSQYHFNF